jgi:uncharacterized protein DUF3761
MRGRRFNLRRTTMPTISRSILILSALLAAASAFAQAPADAPAGSTGLCKDGTYWTGPTKRGACSGHKGVATWYGASGSTAAPSAGAAGTSAAAPAAPATPSPAAQSAPATPAASAPPAASPKSAPTSAPAAGGGPGQVWVNTSTKVYHCPGDRWYGKTKRGQYMSESDAVAQGNRADHGKACKASG